MILMTGLPIVGDMDVNIWREKGNKKMTRERIKSILERSQKEHRAIAAYDTAGYSYMDWAAHAAAQYDAPLFLMYYPNFREFLSFEEFVGFKRILDKKYSIPLITHLDHSKDLNEIKEAIAAGFDSVMIDLSDRPYEENVTITKKVVELAHAADVIVEAELGHVGVGSNVKDYQDRSQYTDPGQAKEFTEETGVELLAVAIGNSHGVYAKTPDLDIPLLRKLAETVKTPLVLHGTSLIPEDQVAEAVENGICKVNLATEMYMEAMTAMESAVSEKRHMRSGPGFLDKEIRPAMEKYFVDKICLLGRYDNFGEMRRS